MRGEAPLASATPSRRPGSQLAERGRAGSTPRGCLVSRGVTTALRQRSAAPRGTKAQGAIARWSSLPVLCLLVAAPLHAQAPVIHVASEARRERATAVDDHGYAAYPVTLLSVLGAEITPETGRVVVVLFGDTLRFRPGHSIFTVNRRMEPLYHWVFERDGVLLLPATFFVEWLPKRYPQRVRYDAAEATLTVTAPWARRLGARSRSNGTQAATPAADPQAGPDPSRGDPAAASGEMRDQAPDHLGARPSALVHDPDRLHPGRLIGFIDARVSGVFDSNIGHDAEPRASQGTIGRLAVGIQSAPYYPFLRAHYDLAAYQFDETGWWNRVTHDVTVEMAPHLRPFRFRLAAEVRLGSSTEDREQADQFILRPRIDVQLRRASRLSLYGAQQVRRFPEDQARNDTNRYAGVAFSRALRGGSRWEVNARHEVNASERSAARFVQWTGRADVWLRITAEDRLVLRLTYRSREYDELAVQSTSGTETPRVDTRWTPAVSVAHAFGGRAWEAQLDYAFEVGRSNDADEAYRAHRVELTVRRRW